MFGISNTPVTPPSTAARLPLSRSSLCSLPGSRKWHWLSMTPGRTCSPLASKVSAPWRRSDPMAAILPARYAHIAIAMPLGVATVPPRMIRVERLRHVKSVGRPFGLGNHIDGDYFSVHASRPS